MVSFLPLCSAPAASPLLSSSLDSFLFWPVLVLPFSASYWFISFFLLACWEDPPCPPCTRWSLLLTAERKVLSFWHLGCWSHFISQWSIAPGWAMQKRLKSWLIYNQLIMRCQMHFKWFSSRGHCWFWVLLSGLSIRNGREGTTLLGLTAALDECFVCCERVFAYFYIFVCCGRRPLKLICKWYLENLLEFDGKFPVKTYDPQPRNSSASSETRTLLNFLFQGLGRWLSG